MSIVTYENPRRIHARRDLGYECFFHPPIPIEGITCYLSKKRPSRAYRVKSRAITNHVTLFMHKLDNDHLRHRSSNLP